MDHQAHDNRSAIPLAARWAALAFLAVVAVAPATGAAPTLFNPSVQERIDAAVEKERVAFGGKTLVPGVIVGVWDAAGGSYTRAFGAADLAANRPLRTDDHFRIGSNTKTFVVSVLLQLVDEGKLSLDDPLSRFALGVTVPNADRITVRQLCMMRSGLFESYDTPEVAKSEMKPDQTFDARTMVGWAVKQTPHFPPGTGYNYSNTNYLLLGLIIEAVAHEPVAVAIRNRLIEPFHLTQTTYPTTQSMPAPWAHGYGLGKTGTWEDVSGTIPVSLMGAAGAMISDMADSRRWVKLYVEGKTNSAATQKERLTCLPTGEHNLSFGLGIGCSAGWYGYSGGLPGYNTAAYYFPAGDVTILAWVTDQAETPFPGVANAIVRDIAEIVTPANVPFR